MHRSSKHSAAALRAAERREREDRAPRLVEEVPDLASLRLDIEERSEGTAATQPKYIRRVVVDSAPALFLVPCGDANCNDGGHDLTRLIMQALRSHSASFHGEDSCRGSIGAGSCSRVLHFEGVAEYKGAAPGAPR